ncbi:MAG: DUF5615 family PIN-like protein [Gammaproteobacteria bacterium]|nr:DUF5615 family PIN-like protein [Gammaproteobacteria bacterium]
MQCQIVRSRQRTDDRRPVGSTRIRRTSQPCQGHAGFGNVKFLIDAQLPVRLAHWMREKGHDVIHTRDLPNGNRTKDQDIIRISMREQRTVVTKDGDNAH